MRRLVPPAHFHAPQDPEQFLSRNRRNRTAPEIRQQIALHPPLENRDRLVSPGDFIQVELLRGDGPEGIVGDRNLLLIALQDTRFGTRLMHRMQSDICGVEQPERFCLATCPNASHAVDGHAVDQGSVPLLWISHGFTTGRPAAMNGTVSRVATVNP